MLVLEIYGRWWIDRRQICLHICKIDSFEWEIDSDECKIDSYEWEIDFYKWKIDCEYSFERGHEK